jgi:hypothetical protein
MRKDYIMIIALLTLILLLIGFRKPIKKLMTRGYINKNPGNIRKTPDLWQGEIDGKDKDFKTFKSMPYGYRAIFVLIRTYMNRMGLDTVRKIISTYAPHNENDTQAYVTNVSRWAGIHPDDPISMDDTGTLKDIVAGISRQENGITPDLDEIDNGFKLFLES